MSNQQKIIFHTTCFPITSCFAVVLFFNYQFLQFEPSILKNPHNLKRHRNHVPFLASVSHQNSTKLIFFQHTVALLGYRFHFFKEVFDFQMR